MIIWLSALLAGALTAWSGEGRPVNPNGCDMRSPYAPLEAMTHWIGHWTVRDANGRAVGTSDVENVALGCGILERYTGVPPAGPGSGAGLHAFDMTTQSWHLLWTADNQTVVAAAGHVIASPYSSAPNSAVVYEWSAVDDAGHHILKRQTLTNTDGGFRRGFRKRGESSRDAGASWVVEFDWYYAPRAPIAPLAAEPPITCDGVWAPDTTEDALRRRAAEATSGDRVFLSSSPNMRTLNPRVYEVFLDYSR